MSREDAQMKIRLPAELKERLEKAAQENKRSMNAEVIHRLKESFNFYLNIEYDNFDKELSDSNIWHHFLESLKHSDVDTEFFAKLFEKKYELDKENEKVYNMLLTYVIQDKNKKD
ncbi:Arc family DNA-binding protein [Salmonella enterica]|nr:Arc family DNA-binding protein [Salmonella enterica]